MAGPVRSRTQPFERSINIVQERLSLVRTIKIRLGHESDSTLARYRTRAPARYVLRNADEPAHSRVEVQERGVNEAPYVNADERYVGVVQLETPQRELDEPKDFKNEDVVGSAFAPIHQSVHLDVVLETLTSIPQTWAAVIDDDRHVIGTTSISISDIVRNFRRTLRADLRRVSQLGGSTGISAIQVSDDSSLVGKTVHSTSLPRSVLITPIERGRDVIGPTGDAVFIARNRLMVLGVAKDLAKLSELASSKCG